MFSKEQLKEIENMGIEISPKSEKVKGFSPNKFASYIADNLKIINNKDYFYVYKDGVWKKLDDMYLFQKLRNKLHTYFDDIWSLKIENEYIQALKRIVYYGGDLNANKRYINLLNGMFDLETFTLVEHSPEFYSSIQLPITLKRDVDCPNFKKFLGQCFSADEEAINLAQEWAGYLLTAETRAQKALILYGLGKKWERGLH